LPASAEQQQIAKPAFLSLGDFTINLPGEDGELSYVVITVTLEVTPSAANQLKGVEPLLKEAIMRRLMVMADHHMLQPGRTDPLVVKASLLDCIAAIQPDSVSDVLITRLLYG
jgi:hypothetical protein